MAIRSYHPNWSTETNGSSSPASSNASTVMQGGMGLTYVGVFNFRGSRYLHIKWNAYTSDGSMNYCHAFGYNYSQGVNFCMAGWYHYNNNIYNAHYTKWGTHYNNPYCYKASDGRSVIRFDRNGGGYTEGGLHVYYGTLTYNPDSRAVNGHTCSNSASHY